ncbi:sensor histidine kinase [Miltoncostaea marina]|uniref:sensor histidine kinase n=1 Tax=Miltoncostaea marina TaxID=2843215 RepID=UPI001C3D2C52|nr:histidine kinase [Miltoncostaea marina]
MPLRPPRVRPGDAALAAALAAVQVAGTTLAARGQDDRRALDAAAYALLVAGPAALALARRRPVGALWAVTAATLAYLVAGYPFGPVVLSVVAALVIAVAAGHRWHAWAAAAALYGGHFAGMEARDLAPGASAEALVGVGTWLVITLTAAEVVRGARERRAARERAAEEAARRRADEVRLELARDLHDVLAHSLSLINVQAGVALHLIDERPQQARTALAAIKEASGDALREVRATLGALRGRGDGPPRAPAPSLSRLGELVGGASEAGPRVEVEVAGDRRPLPAGVDQAAFRIVQEALTNVRRHAGAARAVVRLDYGGRELTVTVDDDGRGPAGGAATAPGGAGIAGMRERAAALGGALEAGARPGGGFRVRARLPLDGAS